MPHALSTPYHTGEGSGSGLSSASICCQLNCSVCRNSFHGGGGSDGHQGSSSLFEKNRPFALCLPVSLSCGHVLCKTCLVKLRKQICPFDQTSISDLLFNVAPINVALLQLADTSIDVDHINEYISMNKDAFQHSGKQNSEFYVSCLTLINHLVSYITNKRTFGSYPPKQGGLISRTIQRKISTLINCQIVEGSGRKKSLKSCRSIVERVVNELILAHQQTSHHHLSSHLWAVIRSRGCQFLGPALQEEVLKLILVSLEDGSSLSRKVLVMFIVQKLNSQYAQISKTSVGHVVQLLYRASCFRVTKRNSQSSLMELKEEFHTYDALRKEHDAQIVQIALESSIRLSPEQWSSLLYGDLLHKSHMQSIIDKLQNTPASFGQAVQELSIALQRNNDPFNFSGVLNVDCDFLANYPLNETATDEASTVEENENWSILLKCLTSVKRVLDAYIVFNKGVLHSKQFVVRANNPFQNIGVERSNAHFGQGLTNPTSLGGSYTARWNFPPPPFSGSAHQPPPYASSSSTVRSNSDPASNLTTFNSFQCQHSLPVMTVAPFKMSNDHMNTNTITTSTSTFHSSNCQPSVFWGSDSLVAKENEDCLSQVTHNVETFGVLPSYSGKDEVLATNIEESSKHLRKKESDGVMSYSKNDEELTESDSNLLLNDLSTDKDQFMTKENAPQYSFTKFSTAVEGRPKNGSECEVMMENVGNDKHVDDFNLTAKSLQSALKSREHDIIEYLEELVGSSRGSFVDSCRITPLGPSLSMLNNQNRNETTTRCSKMIDHFLLEKSGDHAVAKLEYREAPKNDHKNAANSFLLMKEGITSSFEKISDFDHETSGMSEYSIWNGRSIPSPLLDLSKLSSNSSTRNESASFSSSSDCSSSNDLSFELEISSVSTSLSNDDHDIDLDCSVSKFGPISRYTNNTVKEEEGGGGGKPSESLKSQQTVDNDELLRPRQSQAVLDDNTLLTSVLRNSRYSSTQHTSPPLPLSPSSTIEKLAAASQNTNFHSASICFNNGTKATLRPVGIDSDGEIQYVVVGKVTQGGLNVRGFSEEEEGRSLFSGHTMEIINPLSENETSLDIEEMQNRKDQSSLSADGGKMMNFETEVVKQENGRATPSLRGVDDVKDAMMDGKREKLHLVQSKIKERGCEDVWPIIHFSDKGSSMGGQE